MADPAQFKEVDIFSPQHDVYPLIDPKPFWTAQEYKDKVVLITGASLGIGLTVATFYARAGANLALVSRKQSNLDEAKAAILKEEPSAKVILIAVDVAVPDSGKEAVLKTVEAFGRLDILIANAATLTSLTKRFGEQDLTEWWHVQEVNVRGVINFVHAALPELLKVTGQIIVTSSAAAHFRTPTMSDYLLSKHTVDRFVELFTYAHPDIKAYVVHPGAIDTPGARTFGFTTGFTEVAALPAATYLWLTARKAEFLSGRYIQATWDLNEVLAAKDEIVRDNLLVTKLAGPAKSP